MPKHKKTFKQKILADKRREAQNTSLYSLSPESLKQIKTPATPIKQTVSIAVSSYDYLISDLRKTALFTGFIVLIELLLKNFIK